MSRAFRLLSPDSPDIYFALEDPKKDAKSKTLSSRFMALKLDTETGQLFETEVAIKNTTPMFATTFKEFHDSMITIINKIKESLDVEKNQKEKEALTEYLKRFEKHGFTVN
jgi:hypothetical protein